MNPTRPGARPRRVLAAAIAFTIAASAVLLIPLLHPAPARAQDGTSAVTRDVTFSDGATGEITVSKTEDLRNEIVRVEWSGFTPSMQTGGIAGSYGALAQTRYPVLILQCAHAPGEAAQRENCMATYRTVHPQADLAESWPTAPEPASAVLPFTDIEGTSYPDVFGSNGPSDWLTYGYGERVGLTVADGTGAIDFPIRTGDESPASLGCGRSPAAGEPASECSLVIVPVRPMTCDPAASARERLKCNQTSNSSLATHNYTSALMGSHWRNRIEVPLQFAPPDGYCEDTGQSRLPVMGSELTAEALYSWIPAMCRADDPLEMTYLSSGENLARQMYTGGEEDFVLGSRPADGGDRPTVHAPAAISGFGIAFVLDDSDGKQVTQLHLNARLVAKLLTQSYTGTFCSGSEPWLCGHLEGNPTDLLADPEFQALNPHVTKRSGNHGRGLDTFDRGDPMASLVLPSSLGDVPDAVTQWILADHDAAAFLAGAPDESGMTVNPLFTGWALPVDGFEWRDNYTVAADAADVTKPYDAVMKTCGGGLNYCPYTGVNLPEALSQSSASIRTIASRVLAIAQSLQVTRFSTTQEIAGQPLVLKRSDPQDMGFRNMIGIVDLATADRYGLNLAALSTGGADDAGAPVFAAPTTANMFKAVQGGVIDEDSGMIRIDYGEVAARGAYPGTMLVYGAAPTDGLDDATAAGYAEFLEYAVIAGQVPGASQGRLPTGYLSLPPQLAVQSVQAAESIRTQDGAVVVPPPVDDPDDLDPPPGVDDDPIGGSPTTPPASVPTGNPSGDATSSAVPNPGAAPSADPTSEAPPGSGDGAFQTTATQAEDAGWATWALPGALALGAGTLAAAMASGAIGADPASRLGRLVHAAAWPVRRLAAAGANLAGRR
ncbi:hypothetical protein [Glycomyces sp. NPDC047010]|uniref:hypothetical protein n=1 Tax=Glycomyces sp. NPDC047010 TaxID=3155023 RepID=UPI0033D82BD2